MDLFLKFLFAALASALAIIFSSVARKYSKRDPNKDRQAPEAGGAWPIIGHLHHLGASKLPHKALATMAEKYGPIFRIRLGVNPALVVSSWEMARECLLVNDKAASGRPKAEAVELMCYNYANFGFSPYGPYWRYVRKIVMLELLSSNRLNLLCHVWESEVKMFTRKLYEDWTSNKSISSSNMVLVDIQKLFGDSATGIIVRIISGKQFGSENEECLKFKRALRDCFRLLGLFVVGDALPYLRWLNLGGHEMAMKKTFIQLDEIFQGWLEEHKEERSMTQRKDDLDFMDVMLSAIGNDTARDFSFDADTIIKSTCQMMILGGSDTTTVTLTWALSLLLNNRHVLRKAKEELDIKVGKDRQVHQSDIPNLVYLQAIIKETLRLYPPGPLLGHRSFIEDCFVDGYRVRSGTRLIVNLYKMSRDPRIWENPLEFQPERFLTTHKHVDVVTGQHIEFIPFGSGRRICPGASFALHVVHLTLANLIHGFMLSTPSDAPIDMSESFGLTCHKTEPLQVLIAPMLSSRAYAM